MDQLQLLVTQVCKDACITGASQRHARLPAPAETRLDPRRARRRCRSARSRHVPDAGSNRSAYGSAGPPLCSRRSGGSAWSRFPPERRMGEAKTPQAGPLAAGTQKPRGQANETSRERGWQFECPDALSGLPCEEAGCNRGRTNAVVASAVLRIRRQTFTARRESAPTAVRSGSGGAPRRRDALAQSGARLRHA